MEEMLCNGELDLFIGVMYQDNPKLDSTPLLNDHIYMVCSDHLLKKYYPDTWSVLKNRSERGTDLSAFPSVCLGRAQIKLAECKGKCLLGTVAGLVSYFYNRFIGFCQLPGRQGQAEDLSGIPVHRALHFPVSL